MVRRLSIAAAALALVALGFGASTVLGERGASPLGGYAEVDAPPLTAASAAASAKKGKKGKRGGGKQAVTHLVTTDPVEVRSGESVFVALKCPKRAGVPVSGGGVLPGAPGLELTAVSRFNPNTGNTAKRTFYVGARNVGTERTSFLGSVACLSKAKEK